MGHMPINNFKLNGDKEMKKIILFLMLIFMGFSNAKTINVFAAEPEWAAVVYRIAGDNVKIKVALSGKQDPHHIQARPALISGVRNANILIKSGADLEIGWLPKLLEKAGNNHLVVIDVSKHIDVIKEMVEVDRKNGDVHPEGNPHSHLNPNNMLKVAKVVADTLARIDPENANLYKQNNQRFQKEFKNYLNNTKSTVASLKGKKIITNHDSWQYLAQWTGIVLVATLEEKPGIEPSAKYLDALIKKAKQEKVALIIRAPFYSDRYSKWLSQKTGIPYTAINYSIDDYKKAKALEEFYESLLTTLKK